MWRMCRADSGALMDATCHNYEEPIPLYYHIVPDTPPAAPAGASTPIGSATGMEGSAVESARATGTVQRSAISENGHRGMWVFEKTVWEARLLGEKRRSDHLQLAYEAEKRRGADLLKLLHQVQNVMVVQVRYR
jgi:hypothetical protein